MRNKQPRTKARQVSNHSKVLAAKVLVESTKGAKALSHHEKRVAAKALSGLSDGEGPIVKQELEQTIAKPHVRDVLVEALAKIGVNPEKLALVLAEGLDAKSKKYFSFNGSVMDEREDVDHITRHKFMETALAVMGAGPNKNGGQAPTANVFVFRNHLSGKPIDVEIGAPQDAVVSRRLKAAKVRNRKDA